MSSHYLQESVNYKAFDRTISTNEIEAYRASKNINPGSAWVALIVILAFMSLIFFIGFVVKVITGLADGHLGPSKTAEALVVGTAALAFALPIFPLYFLNKSAANRTIAKILRYRMFAADNHWQYTQRSNALKLPGMLFNEGTERLTSDIIRSQNGVVFTIGTHDYVTGVGRGRSTNEWGFIAVPVATTLSHVVLDAIANNGRLFKAELFTNLPQSFAKDKRISVSPTVDEMYHVYSADANGSAIGTVITPEFIRRMKQLSKPYDIEIVGNTVFVYCYYGFKKTKEPMTEVMGIIDIIVEAFGVQPSTSVVVDGTEVTADAKTTPVLKGQTPTYLKALGIFAVIIQFVALIALIISQNQ